MIRSGLTITIDGLSFFWRSSDNGPARPFRHVGKIWHKGWDIPTNWVVDGIGQCWKCSAHGSSLFQAEPWEVLAEMDTHEERNILRGLVGLPLEEEEWQKEARSNGWEPPAPGWTSSDPDWMMRARGAGWTKVREPVRLTNTDAEVRQMLPKARKYRTRLVKAARERGYTVADDVSLDDLIRVIRIDMGA